MFARFSLILTVCASTLTGCEALTELGSQCVNGACSSGDASSAPDCLVSALGLETADLEQCTSCAGDITARDEHGLVACEVLWLAQPGQPLPAELEQCTGALSPLDAHDPNGPGCHVNQVPAPAAGAQPEGAGFYYDSEELGQPTHLPPRGFRYTPGLKVPAGARTKLLCSSALRRTSDGSVKSVPAESCAISAEALAASGAVGQACLPSPIPTTGLDDSEAYLDTAAPGCGGSPCISWHLRGDPSPECSEQAPPAPICAPADQVKERAYCTCRCDLPADQQGPTCRCPNDYTCTPVFERGDFAGSYCVLSSTVAQP